MDNNKLVILRFEGVLQAWDAASKWDERGTELFPTKSGVAGLLGCAMGIKRDDPALVELSNAITMAVRADRPGEYMIDYQTVTGDPLLNAEGKPKSTGNTLVSKRAYLRDACFTVILGMDEEWHTRIVNALKNPRWPFYLGRKTCVPSRPVLECENPPYTEVMEALVAYPPAERSVLPMPFETEVESSDLSGLSRSDKLVSMGRGFSRRTVWRGTVKELPV